MLWTVKNLFIRHFPTMQLNYLESRHQLQGWLLVKIQKKRPTIGGMVRMKELPPTMKTPSLNSMERHAMGHMTGINKRCKIGFKGQAY